MDWWTSIDPTIRPAVISSLATVLTAVVGLGVVFFQIGRQARNAIKQNKLNEAIKLKISIYDQTVATSEKAQAAVIEFTSFLRQFSLHLNFIRVAKENGYQWQQPTARFLDYQRLQSEAGNSCIMVMTMIDRWQIVEPNLSIFRRCIAMGLDGLRIWQMKQPNVFVQFMPIPGYEDKWKAPEGADLASVMARINGELYEMGRVLAWIGDFQVEMQRLLLGDLFPNKVEYRDPPDPSQFCIRLDRLEEIESKLRAMEWGKRQVETEAEAWSRFSTATPNGVVDES